MIFSENTSSEFPNIICGHVNRHDKTVAFYQSFFRNAKKKKVHALVGIILRPSNT
jgi:hypothetical protein